MHNIRDHSSYTGTVRDVTMVTYGQENEIRLPNGAVAAALCTWRRSPVSCCIRKQDLLL